MGSAPVRDREQSMWGAWKLRHLRRREHGLNILTRVYIYICMYIYTVTVHMYSWDFGTCTLHTKSWLSVPCCHGANGENMQDADAAAGAAVATVEIAARKDNLS